MGEWFEAKGLWLKAQGQIQNSKLKISGMRALANGLIQNSKFNIQPFRNEVYD
ncbi:MAG: hypothetical protein KJP00_01695 [Bacteroidia bacterium]|nr:hypothetical protein [Bacteroidia bacterium]